MKKLTYLLQLISLVYSAQANAYASSCVECDLKDTQPRDLLQLKKSVLQAHGLTQGQGLVEKISLPIKNAYGAIEYGEELLPIVFDQKSGAPMLKNKEGKLVSLSKLKGPQRLYLVPTNRQEEPEFLGSVDPQTAQVDSETGVLTFDSKLSQYAQWYNWSNWPNWDNSWKNYGPPPDWYNQNQWRNW